MSVSCGTLLVFFSPSTAKGLEIKAGDSGSTHTPRTPQVTSQSRTCVPAWERKQNPVGMQPPTAPTLSESGSLTRVLDALPNAFCLALDKAFFIE
jgi:hypothetical protein